MTRNDILNAYHVDPHSGVIRSPGKFEGEMLYVPHFWEIYLDGFSDRDDGRIIGFDLTAEDKAEFPELKGKRTVRLFQRDDGFVCEC